MAAGAQNYPDIQFIDPADHGQGHEFEVGRVSEEGEPNAATDLYIQIQIPVLFHLQRENAPKEFSRHETV
jgi:hypothetical protein